jgi:O-acetylhomoserine/O-acetylserine sulfhydrylase-like pyridoxal-dependent enzyme
MRIYLLRIISFLHYYNAYKKIKMNNDFTFLNWLKKVRVEGNTISLESLSTLNSFKYVNGTEKVNDNIMEQTKEQDQINEFLFNHFKLR